MTKNKKDLSRLLPDRHPQPDFFVCDIFDATPKSDTASMEFPLFTLSTKPDMAPREYVHGDKWIKISPSPLGLATVHDRDILIYCISQCMAALNQGREVKKKMRFQAVDLLVVTNRRTSGEGYKLLRAALKRLQGTQIETNIETGGEEVWKLFSFIENAEIVRKTRDGRMQEVEITLSDWVFNAIRETGGDILTISRDYFRLRKPLERRLYELARKMCGTRNREWKLKLRTLYDRTGSTSTYREFKRMMKVILDDCRHIPDYTFELLEETVYIRPKSTLVDAYKEEPRAEAIDQVILKPETFEKAKRAAPGYDVYFLEAEWRRWWHESGKPALDSPDGAFIGFCKKRHEINPNP